MRCSNVDPSPKLVSTTKVKMTSSESPKSAIWNCPTMLVGWWISWLHVFTGFYPQETMKCNYRINHHSYKVFFCKLANHHLSNHFNCRNTPIFRPKWKSLEPQATPPPSALAPVVLPKFPGAESGRGSVLWGTRCSHLFEPIEMVRRRLSEKAGTRVPQ